MLLDTLFSFRLHRERFAGGRTSPNPRRITIPLSAKERERESGKKMRFFIETVK